MQKKLTAMMGITLAVCSASVFSADRTAERAATPPAQVSPAADNTGTNTRDRAGTTQTPQKQTNAAADRQLLAAVRRAVVDDKALSTAAHNVKIVTIAGVVTLRGPVGNAREKSRIEELARQVAGVSRVENQLDIKTN